MKSKKEILSSTLGVCLAAGVCCLLWGSAFPFIKIGYSLFSIQGGDYSSQILFAGIRFTLAGILTVLFGSIISNRFLIPKRSSLAKIPVLSLFQTVLQYIFFYIGLANTTGTKSSVINSISVFFAVIISTVLLKDRLTAKKTVGCIVGFVGVVIINLTASNGFDAEFSIIGEGFIILSALSYAFSSVFLKIFSKSENTVVLSGYQFVLGGVVMILAGIILGGEISTVSVKGVLLVIYLAFVSAAAYTLWGALLKYNEVSRVAVFGFMTPIFGCVLSALFLREKLTQTALQVIISLLLVCVGIYLVNAKDSKRKESSE
ncbi:MAG: DMT family transporter [Eubacteriales bacterium]|nr:DMT family transporter [Eubacteriales bacterium]